MNEDEDMELERGDEPPNSPPIGSDEWRARMLASQDELRQLIRDYNDWRKARRERTGR